MCIEKAGLSENNISVFTVFVYFNMLDEKTTQNIIKKWVTVSNCDSGTAHI